MNHLPGDDAQKQVGSLLVRAIMNTSNPGGAQIWLYYPSVPMVEGTPEVLKDLTAKGWREVPPIYQTALFTQLHEVISVHNTFGTDGKNWMLWTAQESAAYVERYPIALVSEIRFDDEVIEQLSKAGMPTIQMLNPLPPPTSGRGGFLLDLQNPDASLNGYRIASLPERAQQRCNQTESLLRETIKPSAWIVQSAAHRIALDPTAHDQENLEHAREDIRRVFEMQERPSYRSSLREVRQLMQELARDYHDHHQALQKKPLVPLPDLTTSHQTIVPSVEHLRGLAQSFGPRVAHSLWNTESSAEQLLEAPNGARLAVRGENGHEQIALHQFIEGGMGVEGIKYMVTLLAAYYEQTGGIERKIDARVTLRQLLQFMGRGDHADDLDEQRKLMHYILYLARTWITALDKIYDQSHRRGRPRRGYLEYSPLIVLEALGSDVRGGIRIPEMVEFHLGKEYWDQMFGSYGHFFTLPTQLILRYDSKRQSQEICLAFYLANMINLNFGTFEIHFPVLLIQTGLQDQQDIDRGHDRTRNALIVLYAIEQLEQDLLIIREAHPHIDTALAALYYTGEAKESDLSEQTLTRIKDAYHHFQALSPTELQKNRRVALQSLLEQVAHNAIKFRAGPLINPQITKRVQGRQEAIKRREQAQEAAQKKKRRKKKDDSV